MSILKIAVAAAGLALLASPCLALTQSWAPPVDSSGQSMLADPDAALESTTSAMKEAYILNNFESGAPVSTSPINSGAPAVGFGPAIGYTRVLDENGVSSPGRSASASPPKAAGN